MQESLSKQDPLIMEAAWCWLYIHVCVLQVGPAALRRPMITIYVNNDVNNVVSRTISWERYICML